MAPETATTIQNGDTILFIGDSITDCGRCTTDAPLGNGYVKLFTDMLLSRRPDWQTTVLNKGIGGNTVVDLRNRWHDDVLRHEPDWLSVKVGINDLHSMLAEQPDSITPERFRDAYTEILARTATALPRCRILLIDPFYISTDPAPSSLRHRVLQLLPAYLDTVHALSKEYGTGLVRTHDLFQGLLRDHDPDTFCPEPVHPHLTGHLIIADAVYGALSGS